MAESELKELRQFGEKIQTRYKKEENISKKLKHFFVTIIKLLSLFYKYGKSMIHVCTHLFYKKYILISDYIKQSTKKNIMSFLHKPQINYSTTYQTKLVEYQKQWKNVSIIIRLRKKKKNQTDHTKTIPLPPSAAVSYYFRQIDSMENHSKKRFNPNSSIWDFCYPSHSFFYLKLKKLFSFFK